MRIRPATVAMAAALVAGPAVGQELSGLALGPDGSPLADAEVVLHRVSMTGGAVVGVDTTGPAGGFRFATEVGDSALYFAAVRYEGSLFIGSPASPGMESVSGYVIQVDPSSEVGAVGAAMGGAPAGGVGTRPAPVRSVSPPSAGSPDVGALALVSILAVVAVAAFLLAAPKQRRKKTRETLLALAEAERLLDIPDLGEDERADAEVRRRRLRERLAPRE